MKAARHCMPLAGSLFIVVFSGLWALAADAAPRTWTDSTGKHKMKATFVSLDDSKVTLEKDDGETIEIDLKKLSKADQKYVADAVAAADDSPFKSKTDSPFKAAPPKTTRPKATPPRKKPGSRQAASAEPASTSEPRIIEVDYSSTALITLANTEAWQVEAPEVGDTFASKPKTAPLPPKTNFFEGLKGIAVNPVAGKAAVAFNFDQPKPTGSTRVVLCDLATGKTTPPASAAVQMVPLAVHDDGKQIVMRRDEFGFGNLDRLELWTL
ncbi:MAG TPA: SHD1 domain-containing protein, partial [Pirellulales bacterium]|nr:SHD1 domain-containing protein [Pirellulales bacterium]